VDTIAVISIDGHVTASRHDYRQYVEERFLDDFDQWERSVDGVPSSGLSSHVEESSQWDSAYRMRDLESNGVVAEVLFPNGVPPFHAVPKDVVLRPGEQALSPELARESRRVYNRWLADFCAAAPGRRSGQALVSFDDVEEAVRDVYWAKEHGLGGISLPALFTGGVFFFDPQLDPFWDACVDVGFPVSQHGGLGAPVFTPPGFAAILTLALEHSFFSGRSLWQMIVGGVFDRFPTLQMVLVETGANWIPFKINELDALLEGTDAWTGFARSLNRERPFKLTGAEYWERNCHAGASPFKDRSIKVANAKELTESPTGLALLPHKIMFGVDYPHFETIFPDTALRVAELCAKEDLTDADIRGILYSNAAAVYGFDLEALKPDIERIGFTLERPSQSQSPTVENRELTPQ